MIFWRIKSLDAILATAEKKSLQRTLGAWQLTLLGVGAIIGTGIFVLTAEAAQKAGKRSHGGSGNAISRRSGINPEAVPQQIEKD